MRGSVLLLASCLVAGPALAHDFVLLPEVGSSGTVALRLLVHDGHRLGDERTFMASRVARMFVRSASGQRPLTSSDGQLPFARAQGLGAGGHWVAVDRVPIDIELEAERFDGYLRHEGLGPIAEERRRRGESDRPGRERYSRHLKAFVQVGERRDRVGCRAVGQDFEVVLRHDPATLRAGHRLGLELRHRGRPLASHPLDAGSPDDPHGQRVITDARGRAEVELREAGPLLLRSVVMERCSDCGTEADWRSWWTAAVVPVQAASEAAPTACR